MRLLIAALLLAGCSQTTPIGSGTSAAPGGVSGTLQAVNAERRQRGKAPVVWDRALERAAAGHAQDMARNNYFSHVSRDGRDLGDRVKGAGFKACFGAENIAMGQQSVDEVMQAWMDSPGHKRNILNGRAERIGVARASGDYWVMVLGAGC